MIGGKCQDMIIREQHEVEHGREELRFRRPPFNFSKAQTGNGQKDIEQRILPRNPAKCLQSNDFRLSLQQIRSPNPFTFTKESKGFVND